VANFDKAHIAYSNIELVTSGINVTEILLKRGFVTPSSYKLPNDQRAVPAPLSMDKVYPVHILNVISPVEVVVQNHSEEMIHIQDVLIAATPGKLSKIEKNETVVALNEGNRFRAVVEGVRENEIDVLYIDYGIRGVIHKESLFELSDDLKNLPPQARTVSLGCLLANSDDTEYLWALCKDSVIYMHLMYTLDSKEYVLFTDREDVNGGTVHSMILNQGLARLNGVSVNGKFLEHWKRWKELECL
jgi:hypothetical protein